MSKIVQIFCAFMALSGSVVAKQSFLGQKTDTQLICAVKNGDRKAVKKLLKSGAAVNELGEDNKTALDAAVEHGHAKIAIDLIKYDAKVTVQDNLKYLCVLCKEHSKNLWIRFPIFIVFSAAAVGIAAYLAFLGLLFTGPFIITSYVYAVFFLSYCAAGAALVGYTISLPFQASVWSGKAQNWMLSVL
jgi:hypothetical protein